MLTTSSEVIIKPMKCRLTLTSAKVRVNYQKSLFFINNIIYHSKMPKQKRKSIIMQIFTS